MTWTQPGVRASLAVCLAAFAVGVQAQTWTLTGPTGGDVRALAASQREPHVVYLGTSEGVLFRSDDGGRRWHRLAPGPQLSGMSIDNIVVTPAGDVLIGYWRVAGAGGGVARSSDGGRSFKVFEDVAGESVRALAIAPSDPARIVAGTLTGVFCSDDGGASWRRISPRGHSELRNVESVAVDARDPEVLYAGTWHLPWKTSDGGKHWHAIDAGMISDSDVFTITPDARKRETLFATACTGIYRSLNGGALWTKLRGIPSSSRRTRDFAQDRERPDWLFAGTTEGLWVSEDAGASWSQRTEKELVINAVLVLPGGGLLLGSDGAGVLRSEDRGRSFVASSNDGFSARLVGQLAHDRANGRLLAVVRNDRFHSGVLVAPRLEGPWTKLAAGLEGREIWSMALSGADVYAGTDDGVFLHRAPAASWVRLPTIVKGVEQHPRVADILALEHETLLLATNRGLLRRGAGSSGFDAVSTGSAQSSNALLSLASGALLATTPLGLFQSDDRGRSFRQLSSGPDVPLRRLLALPGDEQTLFATTSAGLYKSLDGGRGFYRCYGLPVVEVAGFAAHPNGRTLYAGDFARGGLFQSDDRGETWSGLATDGLVPDRAWSIVVDPDNPERLLAATASGGLHVTSLKGAAAPASH